jgi:site-specific recombinase XerD
MFVVSKSTRLDLLENSVLSPIANAYTAYLREHGYSDNTIPGYRNSVVHFAHWLTREDIELADIDDALVRKFVKVHLRACDCVGAFQHSRETVQAALGHLLRVLRSKGCIPARAASLGIAVQEELDRFDAHLDRVCGLAWATRTIRVYYVRAFLESRPAGGLSARTRLQASDIRQFVSRYSKQGQLGAVKVICSSLRSYLRFRALCGEPTETLLAAVPTAAQWRLASLPKTLGAAEIQLFLSVFDRSTATGQRDYAMARCLVDLGLRVKEVAHLQLADLNWYDGTLQIAGGKGGRVDLLPLPVETGRAIVQYLRHGRPNGPIRALFVRHRAPVDAPVTTEIIRWAMRRAYTRTRLSAPWPGTHALRHSTACRLLQAGASLKEIADVLRHRSLNTTTIYAKVDLNRLAQVALPWPGRMG